MEKRICKQCGKEFILDDDEINFYKQKNLQIPKRCKSCRSSNKSKTPDKNKTPNKKIKRSNKFLNTIIIFVIILCTARGIDAITELFVNDTAVVQETDVIEYTSYSFRNEDLLNEHFRKHWSEFSYTTPEEYVLGANEVINNGNSLHKTEKEDGDDVYYLQSTNEIVIVSTDGYIRTYFKPDDKIKYYNEQ